MKSKIYLIFFMMIFSTAVLSQMEVSDKQLQEQVRNVEDLLRGELYKMSAEQVEYLKRVDQTLKDSLMSSTNVATQNNLERDKAFRNWTPSSADLVNMVQMGLQTGSLSDQIAYYNRKFPVPTVQQLSPNNLSNLTAQDMVFSSIINNAALSVADKSFDNVPQIQEQIDFLYRQIDQQTNIKDAQSLNSVILLKIAELQADLIRLQSQQLKVDAVSNAKKDNQQKQRMMFIQNIE